MGHVGEAGAQSIVVRARERVSASEVEVIRDHDEIAGLEGVVDAARGVREEDLPDAGCCRGPDAEHHVLHRVSLV